MDGITCDGCGEALLLNEDVRYVVKIEVLAAYDPLELTREDLRRATPEALARLLQEMEGQDPRELEDQVYRRFQFDLCARCQKRYLKDPLRFRRDG